MVHGDEVLTFLWTQFIHLAARGLVHSINPAGSGIVQKCEDNCSRRASVRCCGKE